MWRQLKPLHVGVTNPRLPSRPAAWWSCCLPVLLSKYFLLWSPIVATRATAFSTTLSNQPWISPTANNYWPQSSVFVMSTKRPRTRQWLSQQSNGDEPEPIPSTPKKARQSQRQSKQKAKKPTSIKEEDDNITPTPVKSSKTKSSPKRSRSPKSPKKTYPAPKDWKPIYEIVRELRLDRSAPVDENGSEALPQRDLGDKIYRFQVLVALLFSSQTKDAVVGEAMRRFQDYGLTVEHLCAVLDQHGMADDPKAEIPAAAYAELNAMIRPVGFHNNKTKYLCQVVRILRRDYQDDIPPTAAAMMELPGIGPKMAFIIEHVAWGTQSGLGIDTHMHRMFNQLRWVQSKTPEQTRVQLESWLPREYWPEVNLMWVGFGQESQQFPTKVIRKALDCSQPREALLLLKRVGVNLSKEGAKMECTDEIQAALRPLPSKVKST